MENEEEKIVAPGNSLNSQQKKILLLIFGSIKCVFPKVTFSGPN